MLDLLDYRQRVHALYRIVRESSGDPYVFVQFRLERDMLFKHHTQSALNEDQRASFGGLTYFDYNSAFRVVAQVDTVVPPEVFTVELAEDGVLRYRRFGRVNFTLPTGSGTLSLYWIMGYGGGLFLPFGDATNNGDTYGGGRYLYDTIKGADVGAGLDTIVLDFNYAYNPSCAYNPRWVCPLTPPENRLPLPCRRGKTYSW
ncbi:MAG: DUF1684 domain-containing protein [Blastochloris sp.]|nr:DUF1684 domain-containing protein [Blastochloris sp.]